MMKRHIAYLKYVLRHKYFVFLACRKCKVSLWRALIHDWHKFLPSEWFPYARTFYKPNGEKQYVETEEFNHAWNLHQKRGKHHWQAWLLTYDRGDTWPLFMHTKYAREMVADWWGAGRAINGKWDADTWYNLNKSKMTLNGFTRGYVESVLMDSAASFAADEELLKKRLRILGY